MSDDPSAAGAALEELAARFDRHRPRLLRIAQRTLGSPWAAEDAVQETWLRLQRAQSARIENLEAWLTTVVSRVCVDAIRSERTRREDTGVDTTDGLDLPGHEGPAAPELEALHADDLDLALSVVLDTLGPLERLALVLHDVFGLPFDEIAPIVERTPTATRQLASRARVRLRSVDVDVVRAQRRGALDAFLGAARSGDFGRLLQLLDPDVELRADTGAVTLARHGAAHGAPILSERVRGADAVARVFAGRAALVEVAVIAGQPSGLYAVEGTPRAVYLVHLEEGRIRSLDVVGDPLALEALGLAVAGAPRSA